MQYVARAAPIVGGLLAVLLIGLIDLVAELRSLGARHAFAVVFQNRWAGYFGAIAQGQPTAMDYAWLAAHQGRMTRELGGADRIDYVAPYNRYAIPNYPALTNTLAASHAQGAEPTMVALVDHLVISQVGALQERHASLLPKLWNPAYLVGRGLRFVVSLPLLVLAWVGLLPAPGLERARRSWFFRLYQFVIEAVVAVAAVMTVVLGWSAFATQLKAWFPWLP